MSLRLTRGNSPNHSFSGDATDGLRLRYLVPGMLDVSAEAKQGNLAFLRNIQLP